MAVTFSLPPAIEADLREAEPKLDEVARDAFLIAQYSAGRIGTGTIATVLGFETRYEAEQWLGARGVNWNYSLQDLEDDRKTINRLFGTKL